MITADQALARYGYPKLERGLVLWDVPLDYEIGVLPKKLYCNRDLIAPLAHAFELLIDENLVGLIKTWDGCFNIRNSKAGREFSLHSWALAIDINAAWNQFNRVPTMDKRIVQCFKRAGFDWGGEWRRPDGMHFQLKEFPK